MDPILHYRVYEEEINKLVIIEYIKPIKSLSLYYSVTDYV